MKLKRPPNETVELFHEFMNEHDQNPSREDIIQFVSVSFDAFEHASPPLLEQDPIRKRQQSSQLFCTVSPTSASNAVYTQQWNKLTQFTIRHRNIQSTSLLLVWLYFIILQQNFDKRGTEFTEWMPADWKESPKYLSNVKDTHFRWFAGELNKLWKILGRKMKNEVAVSVPVAVLLNRLNLCSFHFFHLLFSCSLPLMSHSHLHSLTTI